MGAPRLKNVRRRRGVSAALAILLLAPAAQAQPDIRFPNEGPTRVGPGCTKFSESKPAIVDPSGANGNFISLEAALIEACPYSHITVLAGSFNTADTAPSVRITEPVIIRGTSLDGSNDNESKIYTYDRKKPCVEVDLASRFNSNDLVKIEHINFESEEGAGNRTEACIILKRGRFELKHNTITGTFTAPGILIDGGQATIDDNTIAGTAIGIQVNPSDNDHLIINNFVYRNERGIRLISDDNARVVDNRVSESILEGIRIDGAGGVISGNFIEFNGAGGVYIAGARAAGVSIPEIRSNVIAINNIAELVSDPSADAYLADNTMCSNKAAFRGYFEDFRFKNIRWLQGSSSLAAQKDNNFVYGHKGDKRVSGFFLGGEKLSCPPRGTRTIGNTEAFTSMAPPQSQSFFEGESVSSQTAANGTPTPLPRPEQ